MGSVLVMERALPDRFDGNSWKQVGEIVKTVTFLASVLIALVLVIGGCTDRIEQRLGQVQKNLEQVLRAKLLDGEIRLQQAGDHLAVVITERLLFDIGSYEIKPDGIEVLRQMGNLFKAAPLKEIRVAGHGDRTSAADHSNKYFEKLALSKARATQAVRVLKENGLDSKSFIIEWYGDIRPIASNETEEGRQMNRRVEILLYAEAV
jgi:chemotaxis protein MotB